MYLEITGSKLSELSAQNFVKIPFFFDVPSQNPRYFLETPRFYVLRGTPHTHEFVKTLLERYGFSLGNLHCINLSTNEDGLIFQNIEGYIYFFFDSERGYHTFALNKKHVNVRTHQALITRIRRHPLFEEKHFVHKVNFLSILTPTQFL